MKLLQSIDWAEYFDVWKLKYEFIGNLCNIFKSSTTGTALLHLPAFFNPQYTQNIPHELQIIQKPFNYYIMNSLHSQAYKLAKKRQQRNIGKKNHSSGVI